MLEIARQVNRRHAAAAELSLDDVPLGQRGAQRGMEIRHGARWIALQGLASWSLSFLLFRRDANGLLRPRSQRIWIFE